MDDKRFMKPQKTGVDGNRVSQIPHLRPKLVLGQNFVDRRSTSVAVTVLTTPTDGNGEKMFRRSSHSQLFNAIFAQKKYFFKSSEHLIQSSVNLPLDFN